MAEQSKHAIHCPRVEDVPLHLAWVMGRGNSSPPTGSPLHSLKAVGGSQCKPLERDIPVWGRGEGSNLDLSAEPVKS